MNIFDISIGLPTFLRTSLITGSRKTKEQIHVQHANEQILPPVPRPRPPAGSISTGRLFVFDLHVYHALMHFNGDELHINELKLIYTLPGPKTGDRMRRNGDVSRRVTAVRRDEWHPVGLSSPPE